MTRREGGENDDELGDEKVGKGEITRKGKSGEVK